MPVPLLDRDRRSDGRGRREAALRPGQAALSPSELRARFDRPLGNEFFDRPTARVARDILGRWVMVRFGRALRAARIVETEAYVARDPANHADRGRTERNRSMFAAPGTLYVYRIHQVHCANAVTRPGQAVLLRAAEPVTPGLSSLSGPGRLCRGLGISKADDGISMAMGRIRIVEGDSAPEKVVRTVRVGISKAVDRPLRFLWNGHPAVSSPRPWRRGRP